MKSALTRPAALGLLLLAACRDAGPTGPDAGSPDGPGYLISDATHQGGVPQFYWLPPTVPNPGPTVTGTFDGDLLGGAGVYPQLEVRICPAGSATLCPASGAGSLKSFNAYSTTPAISKDQANQNYQLNWNKPSLTAGNTYRAWALVTVAANASPLPLGYADVRVVANSKALKQVNLNQFVGLIAGNPLYLKFTVRTGIAAAISVALGSSVLAPGGTTTATATVTDLHGAALEGATVNWAVTPAANPPGSVSPGSSATGSAGTATSTLIAGNDDGGGAVTATTGTAPGQLTGSASFVVGTIQDFASGALALGRLHSCGLTAAGAPYCWGQNNFGQLGDGSGTESLSPVAVDLPAGVTGFEALTSYIHQTCGRTSSGAWFCWGNNEYGQLGNNSKQNSPTPEGLLVPNGVSGFASLAMGATHTCGLTDAGTPYCWGNNVWGQLGDASNDEHVTPEPVSLPSGVAAFVSLASGQLHSCGLTATGAAYCWGRNESGQLGDGTTDNSPVPIPVVMPNGVSGFTRLVAGVSHTCGLTGSGAAYCWGLGFFGSLGTGSTSDSPVPVAVSLPGGVSGFAGIRSGGYHTCGLTTTGDAYCWGHNEMGQTGNGTFDQPQDAPVAVVLPNGVSGFELVALGGFHTCGLTDAGEAYCWGHNDGGQLGDGFKADLATPQAVIGGLTFQAP